MSVTRGKFLKELGKSLPGVVLGSGVAAAAHKVIGKMAAVADVGLTELPPTQSNDKRNVAPSVNEVKFITNGPTVGNRVALTFDDGPTPGVTDLILHELKARGLRATFFMIGERVAAEPELARQVLAEGHEVGNHTFTHPDLTKLSASQVAAEIERTQDVMGELLNHRPKWFRPPYGALRKNQAGLLTERSLRVVLWKVDSKDWSQPGVEKITETILAATTAGSIIVCHDLYRQTFDALRPTLDGLIERAFIPTTLSSLLE